MRKNKYNRSIVVTEDGLKFDSKKEYERWLSLKQLESVGKIFNLDRQVKFTLLPKNELYRELNYIADFVYTDENGIQHIEDVKGMILPEFKVKQKLFYHLYHKPIEIHK